MVRSVDFDVVGDLAFGVWRLGGEWGAVSGWRELERRKDFHWTPVWRWSLDVDLVPRRVGRVHKLQSPE